MQNNPLLPELMEPSFAPLGILDYINPLDDAKMPSLPQIPDYGSGSSFGKEAVDPIFNQMEAASRQQTMEAKLAPVRFDWDREKTDRYINSENFHALGLELGGDNEEKYAAYQTWGNTMGNAAAGAWKLGASTFVDGWKGWGRAVDALFSWDGKKLMGSDEELAELAKYQNDTMNKYAIFASKESEGSIFNRQFLGNMVQQGGFMLGTIAQFAAEEVLTMGATNLIGGGLKATRAARLARQAERAVDIAEATLDMKRLSDIWKAPGIMSKVGNSLKKAIPFVESIQDMRQAYNAGAGVKQLAYLGGGALKRGFAEANMAFTEARMEAAGTYGDLKEKLLQEYEDRTGKVASGAELTRIEQAAHDAAWSNFKINSAVLGVMNRIQFDHMFSRFNPERMLFRKAEEELAEGAARKAFTVTAKVGDQMVSKAYKASEILGRAGAVGQIAADFGRKTAAKEFAKSVGVGLLKWEGSEGLQELIQEGSNNAAQDYYYDLYKTGHANWNKSIGVGVDSQKNMQGLKTFLTGALTGRLFAPISFGVGKVSERLQTKAEDRQKAKTEVTDAITQINEFYANPGNVLKEQVANLRTQQQGALALEDALRNKDRYTYQNVKDSTFAKTIAAAKKLNMLPSLLDNIKGYGEHLSEKEFTEAFPGIDFSKENRTNAKQFMDHIATQVEEYSNTYDKLMDKYGNSVMPELYKDGSVGQMQQLIKKQILMDAIEVIATNHHKAKRAYERLMDIHNEASANPNMGGSLADAFRVLGSHKNVQSELALVEANLKGLEGLEKKDDAVRSQIKGQRRRLEALKAWHEYHTNFNLNGAVEEQLRTKAQAGFRKYINGMNGENDMTFITDDDVQDQMKNMEDYVRLSRDSKDFTDAFNKLADPIRFAKFHAKMAQGAEMAVRKMRHEAINDALKSKIGFSMDHQALVAEANELDAKENPTAEDAARYEEIVKELAEKADNYDDSANRKAVAALKDSNEFRSRHFLKFRTLEFLADALREAHKEQDADKIDEIQERIDATNEAIDKAAINEFLTKKKLTDEAAAANPPGDAGAAGAAPAGGTPVTPTSGTPVTPGAPPVPVVTVPISHPQFVSDYNAAVAAFSEAVTDAVATNLSYEDFVKVTDKALERLEGIVAQLEPSEAGALLSYLQDRILTISSQYEQLARTRDDKAVIASTSALGKVIDLTSATAPVMGHLNSAVDASKLDLAINQLNTEINHRIEKVLEQLKPVATTAADALAQARAENAITLGGNTQIVEDFEKESVAMQEKLEGANLNVAVPENFSNPINFDIQNSDYDGAVSAGQEQAIQNLINAGVLLESDELMEFYRSTPSRKTASDVINMAVGRIHIIELNKLINDYIKTGDPTQLTAAYLDYRKNLVHKYDSTTKSAIRDEEADTSFWKNAFPHNPGSPSRDALMEVMGLPQSAVLSDEQFKALSKYRRAIDNFQRAAGVTTLVAAINNEAELTPETAKELHKHLRYEKGVAASAKLARLNLAINDLQSFVNANLYTELQKGIRHLINEYGKTRGKGVDGSAALVLESYILSRLTGDKKEEDIPEVLTDEQLDKLINAPVPVSASVRDQVQARMNTHREAILEQAKKAIGTNLTVDAAIEPLTAPDAHQEKRNYVGGRQKSAADIRMGSDLREEYETAPGKVNAHHALNVIIESEFATDSERALASRLLELLPEDMELEITDGLTRFDPNTGTVLINFDQIGFDDEANTDGLAVEQTILHELMHQQTYQAIETNEPYRRQIASLYRLAKKEAVAQGVKFYAFESERDGSLSHLHEFITETFTSPAFQHFLSKIDYANSNKSLWRKFIEVLQQLFNVLGLKVENNVLNQVVGLTTDMLDGRLNEPTYTQQAADEAAAPKPKKTSNYEKYEAFLTELPTHDTVDSLQDLTKRVKKELPATPTRESLLASIRNRMSEIKVLEKRAQLKSMTPAVLNGKTYYVQINHVGKLEIYRPSRTGFTRVTPKSKGAEKIYNDLVATLPAGSYLSNHVIATLRDLYEGSRFDDNIAERVGIALGAARGESLDARIKRLTADDPQSFEEEVLQFFARGGKISEADFIRYTGMGATRTRGSKAGTTHGKAEKKEMKWAIAKDGVKLDQWIHEISDKWGIEQGDEFDRMNEVIDTLMSNPTREQVVDRLEEVTTLPQDNRPPEMTADIEGMVDRHFTEALATGLSKRLGVSISPISAEKLIDQLRDRPEPPAPDAPDNGDPVRKEPTVVHTATYAPNNADMQFEGADDYIGAQNRNALRSTSNDVEVVHGPDGYLEQERPDFQQHYGKVRNVINRLRENGQWHGLHITMVRDNADFRWDGSDRYDSEGSLIGYVSDENGNPVIFDQNGNRVMTVNRNTVGDAKNAKTSEQQIVYFPIIEKDKGFKNFEILQDKRGKIQNGIVHIAPIRSVSAGQMNLGKKGRRGEKSAWNTAQGRLSEQVDQPHVSLSIRDGQKNVHIVVTDSHGVEEHNIAFPPDTSQIRLTDSQGKEQELTDYLMDVLEARHNMLRQMNEGKISREEFFAANAKVINYVRNLIWFTGDTAGLKFTLNSNQERNNMNNVQIKQPGSTEIVTLQLFKEEGGRMVPNKDAVEVLRAFVAKRKLNVHKKSLGQYVELPFTVLQNGEKSLTFVVKDYNHFLLKEMGLFTYISNIPAQHQIERYNSIVEFAEPRPLEQKPVEALVGGDLSRIEQTTEVKPSTEAHQDLDPDISALADLFAPDPRVYNKTCK